MHHQNPSPELAVAAGDIKTLMRGGGGASPSASGGGGSGSFTALLGLPSSQAMELLLPPTFPSDPALVDRAARFSTFAAAAAAAAPDLSSPSSSEPKPSPPPPPTAAAAAKRKDPSEKACKLQGKAAKKGRVAAEGEKGKEAAAGGGDGAARAATGEEKPAYVHVRARRGQATDSHSLAERARREKINARMELLKELVPGCSKVSGTALVLDEIINHVQSLQRQVEYLSMRLAAVNPRVDFGGLDSFLAAECGKITGLNSKNGMDLEQTTWPEMGVHGARQLVQLQQQFWHSDLVLPPQLPTIWERRGDAQPHVFVNPGASLFGYDLASSAQSQPNKLKTEL